MITIRIWLFALVAAQFIFGVSQAATHKTTTVLISIDGFAARYLNNFKPQTLLSLKANGASANLLPVYPSKTFPNHLSIVTGSYTAKHGIIHNTFYNRNTQKKYHLGAGEQDDTWLTATPIWAWARTHGKKTAVYFWPESASDFERNQADISFKYNGKVPNESRIKQIITWLTLPEAEKPDFIASYFSIVDTAGHEFGPNSIETKQAVLKIDALVQQLVAAIKQNQLAVNLILVADHGMMNIKQTIDAARFTKAFTKLNVVNGGTQLLIYNNLSVSSEQIANVLKAQHDSRVQIYTSSNFPQHWHWDQNLSRLPDIVVDAKPGYYFTHNKHTNTKGMHGYDPKNLTEMQALFIANGPAFKQGFVNTDFENVNIFPLLCKLLAIPVPKNIDGTIEPVQPMLTNNK